MSRSAASPASSPITLAIINVFFFAPDCATVVPTIPCVNGSIVIIYTRVFFKIFLLIN